MSNFSVFSHDHLKKLLEPFAPGMSEHITPIKYEALTPDCFMLLFRTTGKDGVDHFFVSLETDFMSGIEGARRTIEDWHGEVVEFWPVQHIEKPNPENIKDFQSETTGPYFALLARVKRPTTKGYWAEAITITPGDTIGEKIKHLSKKDQANVRKTLNKILQHKTDPDTSFLESIQSKHRDIVVNDVNKTDIAVSVYVQPDGRVECFYNHVNNRPKMKRPNTKSSN